jgi:hypothetical protein
MFYMEKERDENGDRKRNGGGMREREIYAMRVGPYCVREKRCRATAYL